MVCPLMLSSGQSPIGFALNSVGRVLLAILGGFTLMMMVSHALAENAPAKMTAVAKLLFREDWKTTPAETPITQDHVATKGLILALHGPGKQWIKKSHHDKPADDPFYVWSGQCKASWAFSLRPKQYSIDLSAPGAKIRLRTRQSGGHKIYVLIKNSGERWYVSKQSVSSTAEWEENELKVGDLKWSQFDISKVVRGKDEAPASLRMVEEIGLTDLQRGAGSDACSRVDWIAVWGTKVGG